MAAATCENNNVAPNRFSGRALSCERSLDLHVEIAELTLKNWDS